MRCTFCLSAAFLIACADSKPPTAPVVDSTATTPAAISLLRGPRPIGLILGDSFRLPVIVLNLRGDTLKAPSSLRIVSANSTIVRVDSGSLVKAVGMGTTRVIGSVLGARGLVADSLEIFVACTTELQIVARPAADTLAVGESFTPSISLWTCLGQIQVQDTFRWSALDTALIKVDSITGQTTGLKPGSTGVLVRGLKNGPLAEVSVFVRQ
jgi:hypothetical protein